MTTRVKLPHNFAPRPYQRPVWEAFDAGQKRLLTIWHRRAGKDKCDINFVARATQMRVGTYFYFLPTFAQGRRIIWEGMDSQGFRFLHHIPQELWDGKPNETDMRVRLKNGSIFQIVGSDKIDRIVGTNPVGCVFSEFTLQDPAGWDFVRPILRENGGWALFNGTPRGKNHMYRLNEMAKTNDEWFSEVLTIDDTGVMTDADVQAERDSGMSEELIQQEFYCSFTGGMEGAYYTEHMAKASEDGRICRVPHDEALPVHTAWDMGLDRTAIIFFQTPKSGLINIIDYHEDGGKSMAHYISWVLRHGEKEDYVYGEHIGPWEVISGNYESGVTREETAKNLGIVFKPAPKLSRVEGINAVLMLLGKCVIDDVKCARLIEALIEYRRKIDRTTKEYKEEPLHNWACLKGDTEVLTPYGTVAIKDLPNTGKVLTTCGWKQYNNPHITRQSAPLVEVTFSDGYTVKCTPEHRFLTVSGWKLAEHLTPGTPIQSGSMKSRNTLTVDCSAFGLLSTTLQEAVKVCIERFGQALSGLFPQSITSTTKTATQEITAFTTWSFFPQPNTWPSHQRIVKNLKGAGSARRLDSPLPTGTDRKKGGYGTNARPNAPKAGPNGSECLLIVWAVGRSIRNFYAKTAGNRSIAATTAKPATTVKNVRKLTETAPVWCLTVPEGGEFALANGAIVHNSHAADALRYLATGRRNKHMAKKKRPRYTQKRVGSDKREGASWMSA